MPHDSGSGAQPPAPKPPHKKKGGGGGPDIFDTTGPGTPGLKHGPGPQSRHQKHQRRQQQRRQQQADQYLNRHSNRGQAVRARQQQLRRAGFKIAVDGVWGPQSQRAWQAFHNRQKADPSVGAPFVTPKGPLPAQRSKAAAQADIHIAAIRDAARQAKQAAAAAASAPTPKQLSHQQAAAASHAKEVQQLALAKQHVKNIIAKIQNDPNTARTVSLTDLTNALVDPDVGLGPTTHTGALAVQNWLDAHGYKVTRSGVWNKATNDQFLVALHDEQRRERIKQNSEVINQLYMPNGLHAGDKAPDYLRDLVPHGIIPSPGELVRMIEHGGMTASMLYENLSTYNHGANWADFQHEQLLRMAGKIQPFALIGDKIGPGVSNDFLSTQLALTIPQTQLSPFGTRGKYAQRQEDMRQAQLMAQLNALVTSHGKEDFKRRLTHFTAVEEQKKLQEEQDYAQGHLGFFGRQLHHIVAPLTYLKSAIEADARLVKFGETAFIADIHLALGSLQIGNGPGLIDYIRMNDDQKAAVWGRAAMAQQDANPVLNFTYQLLADPIYFAKPFKVASSLLRYGGDAGLFGSRLGLAAGRLGKFEFETGGRGLRGALDHAGYDAVSHTWERGSWTKSGLISSGSRFLLPSSAYDKAATIANLALAKKGEALDAARQQVGLAMRHGFKKPAFPTTEEINPFIPSAATRKRLEGSITDFKALHEQDPEVLGRLLRTLTDQHISLYMDSDRSVESTVGEMLIARASETFRVQIAHRLAGDSAWDVIRSYSDAASTLLESHGIQRLEDGSFASYGAHIQHTTVDEVKANQLLRDSGLHDEAKQEAAQAEYLRIMESVGTFVGPSAHGVFIKGNEKVDLHTLLKQQVANRMDIFKNTVMLAWQEEVEANAVRAAHNLWDENMLWVDREAPHVQEMVDRASETFKEGIPVENPLAGVGHSFTEASQAMEDEIARLSYRAGNLAARQAVGKLKSTIELDSKLVQIRKDVEGAWREDPSDGKWYDKRDTVEVSPLYARHMAAAIEGGRSLDGENFLAHISSLPRDVEATDFTPFDTALERLAWRMGGRSRGIKGLGWDVHPTNPRYLSEHASEAHVGPYAAQHEIRMTELQTDAVEEHQKALSSAYDQALPRAMKDQLAIWQAMAHAQSRPIKYLYGALSAGLNLWITATLPLRPAWTVRNVVDNFSKWIIAGIHDPRSLFLGAEHPGQGIGKLYGGVHTAFDVGIYPLRQAVHFLDSLFGTDVLVHFDAIMGHFWALPPSILKKVFNAHGIDVPEHVIQDIKQDFVPGKSNRGRMKRPFEPLERDQHGNPIPREEPHKPFFKTASDTMYEQMGNRPENYFKRAIYRDEVKFQTKRLRKLARFQNPDVFDRPFTVRIDEAKARELVDAKAGAGAKDIEVVFKPMTRDEMYSAEHGSHILGYFRAYPDLAEARAEHGDFLNHYIVLHVPADAVIKTRQQAQAIADYLGGIFLHELRHGVQHGGFAKGLDRAISRKIWKTRDIPGLRRIAYMAQPQELDAHFWAFLGQKRGLHNGVFNIEDGLPSYFNEEEITREAHRLAMQKVKDTLFDYSDVTVLEENLRLFFPFIQFWRKNLGFWTTNILDKPWLPAAYIKWEQEMNDKHSDLPEWMRRYLNSDEIVNAAAVVPGLDKIVEFIIPANAQYDPLNFSSGAPIYRSFLALAEGKQNPNLPPSDSNGWPVIGPILDAMNEWGLGTNPLLEKPLEVAGVATNRSWQTVFPQAGLIIAMNPSFWLERQKSGPIEWARLIALTAMGADANGIAKNMDYYVNAELAGMVARGEPADRARATKIIEDWFLTQNTVSYFTGMYLRRATQSDIYLSKLYDEAVTHTRTKFTSREKGLLKLWAMRGVDPMSYDRYLHAMPDIQTYYRLPSYAASQKYLEDHPELTQYVDPTWRGEPFSHNYIKQMAVHYQADEFFRVSQLAADLGAAHDVRESVSQMLLTPEIQAMWDKNRTPKQRQDRMLQGLVHEQINRVNQGYFSIPESNRAAREDYLNRHPELIRLWNANNTNADDFEAILHSANAELREQFFALIHAGEHDKADRFLGNHPFLWEDTKKADHFNPDTGRLKLKYMSAKGRAYMTAKPGFDVLGKLIDKIGKDKAWNWAFTSHDPKAQLIRDYLKVYGKHAGSSTEHARDYLAVKHLLDAFFKMTKDERSKWLRGNSDGAAKVRAYFKKWAHPGDATDHAKDYLLVKPILDHYFKMPKDVRGKWLDGNSEQAKQLRAYFKKWASDKGMTQHAKDYLSVKSALDHYFSLPKGAARREWLKSKGADAEKVLGYFKKYGSTHKYERAFRKYDPQDIGGTPEQRQRMLFWKRYFELTPDKRPQFIIDHAEQYGVFIYGALSEKKRDELEQAWLRRTHGAHFTTKQLDYLYVKPLLDFYFKLPHGDRPLFLEANPELDDYFKSHPPKIASGNPATDKLIEAYFALDLANRSAFLAAHPEIQVYFDKHSTPAQRAIHSLLSQYFALTGVARKAFGDEHPEIAAYFAARLLEKANAAAASEALYESDPRLAGVRNNAKDMEAVAKRQLDRLQDAAIQSFTPDTIEENRDRLSEPYKAAPKGVVRHRQKKAKADIVPDTRARG